jgi:beta-N-acetylhexosaminidase
MANISAAILGCAGTTLTAEEAAFFRDVKPWGFILFKRNIADPNQVRALTAALRETVGRPDAPILIDQEGGRVARLARRTGKPIRPAAPMARWWPTTRWWPARSPAWARG